MPRLSASARWASFAAALASPALALSIQSDYELIVIEPVGGSTFSMSGVFDVNDIGLVLGRNSINDVLVPYAWTAGGGFSVPALPPALVQNPSQIAQVRLNNAGDMVAPGFPNLVLADGSFVPIPDPLGGMSNGGEDLNDALQVVGDGVSTGTSSGMFTWHPQGTSVTLPIPAGSAVRRINANGIAVGHRLFNGTNRRSFVVDVATLAWIDLHALMPAPGNSEAFDVNDLGAVVGYGPDGTSLSAFVWTQAGGFVYLPGLDGGETMRVYPNAIDNEGRVVGRAMNGAGDFHAFLWDPVHGMTDLNTVVDPGTYTLVEALDISETGVIIGRGFHGTVWGPDRAFILHEVLTGENYCASEPNSTGATGALVLQNVDLGARTMDLAASGLPLHSNAFSICSLQAGFHANPGGSGGNLCLGGAIGRLMGGSVLSTGATGTLLETVNLDSIPQPSGPVVAQSGQTWHFQFWHRDTTPAGPGANFTNGVRITLP